jgi:hypothetical protein
LARTHQPYDEITISKRRGGLRVLHRPEPQLMDIQRRFLERALNRIAPHPLAFAYRSKVSVLECASHHLRAHTVIRLDIADFFASIRERHVFEALLRTDWRPASPFMPEQLCRLAAYELSLLSTVSPPRASTWKNRGTGYRHNGDRSWERTYPYRDQYEGFLPQGAPTSGAISNLVMLEADDALYRLASELGLRYTRYSDDLYFSSRGDVSSHDVDRLIAASRRILSDVDLYLNENKTRVARRGARRAVLGILVDGPTPRLPREVHRAIDLHLRGVDRFGLEAHAKYRGFGSVQELEAHVGGLISWVQTVDPPRGCEHLAHWQRSTQRSQESQSAQHLLELGYEQPAATSLEQLARESIDRLLADGREYRRSKDYAEFVTFVGRFRQYSPFNAALVRLQPPGARYVRTDKVWNETYRRVLRPGAQPLIIMQPGGPYMLVYDVGDTEALPGAPRLPREVTDPMSASSMLDQQHVDHLWNTTVDNAVRDGIRVTLVNNAPLHAGSARWSRLPGTVRRPGARSADAPEEYGRTYEVEVSRHLAPLDRYVTLVHELAHLYCGHLGTPDPKRWASRRGSKVRDEVEAESVAYIVLSRLDPTFKMGDYLLDYLNNEQELPPMLDSAS